MRTAPVSLRLPITRWAGDGDSLRSVGVTTMPSRSARNGCSSRSTISSSWSDAKNSSQIDRVFLVAVSGIAAGALLARLRRPTLARRPAGMREAADGLGGAG